jgi:hypothetical protein
MTSDRPAPEQKGVAMDSTALTSRRALLTGTVAGLAALAAQALSRPAPVAAHDADDVWLGHDNAVAGTTTVRDTTTTGGGFITFLGYAPPNGTGVYGEATSGYGVIGHGTSGIGVAGFSGSSDGVAGTSNARNGVAGHTTSSDASGVYGEALKGGYGVAGRTASGDKPGTFGDNTGAGPGVLGQSVSGTGVVGRALGPGAVGVVGRSDLGRGGRFHGKRAQIKLVPSTAATHPASGSAGDIFLDASKRLWLCKGSTIWALIA